MTRRTNSLVVALSVALGLTAVVATRENPAGLSSVQTEVAGVQSVRSSNSSNANGNSVNKGDFSIASGPSSGQAPDTTDTGPLYPGASRPLTLTIANPNSFDIVVTSVIVTVGAGTRDGSPTWCPGSAISVSGLPGEFPLEGKGTTTKIVTLSMDNTAPDACQGVVWPLTYGGSAVKPNKA